MCSLLNVLTSCNELIPDILCVCMIQAMPIQVFPVLWPWHQNFSFFWIRLRCEILSIMICVTNTVHGVYCMDLKEQNPIRSTKCQHVITAYAYFSLETYPAKCHNFRSRTYLLVNMWNKRARSGNTTKINQLVGKKKLSINKGFPLTHCRGYW